MKKTLGGLYVLEAHLAVVGGDALGGSVFPLRRSAGRLYSLNRADCLHDRKPVPVHPEVADLPAFHLIPRTGSRLPPFASWSDPAKVAPVRRGRAHSNCHNIALGHHIRD